MGLQKKIHLCIIALLMVTFVNAQDKPASPPEVVSGKINDATISINYGSPSVKGRKIWGELVPMDKVWRAGANTATSIETDADISVGGNNLPKGKYSIYMIPSEGEWQVIINSEVGQWGIKRGGETTRNAEKDVVTIKAKPKKSDFKDKSLIDEATIFSDNRLLFLDYIRGFWKAKRENKTMLVTPEQGKFVRNYRWKKMKEKLF